MKTFIKDSGDTLSYKFDWADGMANTNAVGDNGWLQGDTIAASAWVVPAGITKDSDSKTDTTTTIVISGGVTGNSYTVVNKITTASGLATERTAVFMIRNR